MTEELHDIKKWILPVENNLYAMNSHLEGECTDLEANNADEEEFLFPNVSSVLRQLIQLVQPHVPQRLRKFLNTLEAIYLVRLNKLEQALKHQRRVRIVRTLQRITRIPAMYFVLGGSTAAVFVLRTIYRIANALFVDLIEIVYPSWKTLETLDDGDLEDMRQWGTYWLLYSFLQLTNHFRDVVHIPKIAVKMFD
jgi:hypothetical protein